MSNELYQKLYAKSMPRTSCEFKKNEREVKEVKLEPCFTKVESLMRNDHTFPSAQLQALKDFFDLV